MPRFHRLARGLAIAVFCAAWLFAAFWAATGWFHLIIHREPSFLQQALVTTLAAIVGLFLLKAAVRDGKEPKKTTSRRRRIRK